MDILFVGILGKSGGNYILTSGKTVHTYRKAALVKLIAMGKVI